MQLRLLTTALFTTAPTANYQPKNYFFAAIFFILRALRLDIFFSPAAAGLASDIGFESAIGFAAAGAAGAAAGAAGAAAGLAAGATAAFAASVAAAAAGAAAFAAAAAAGAAAGAF